MKNALLLILFIAINVHAQGTIADYERASGLRAKYAAAAIDMAGTLSWIGTTSLPVSQTVVRRE